MRVLRVLTASLALSWIGCGGGSPAPSSQPAQPAHTGPFASTPLTPFAEEVTALALAAAAGRALPDNRLHVSAAKVHVAREARLPAGEPLAFGMAMEADLLDASDKAEHVVQAMLVLTRRRLTASVHGVSTDAGYHPEPNAQRLSDVTGVVGRFLDDVAAGRGGDYQADGSDCDVIQIGHGHACSDVTEPVVAHPSVLEALRNPMAGRRSFTLNQLAVVFHDAAGGMVTMKMDPGDDELRVEIEPVDLTRP